MNDALTYVWMMAFTRAGGIVMLLPVFSAGPVPIPVRLAIAGFLAYLVSVLLPGTAGAPGDLATFVLAAVHELLIGLIMGFAVRLAFFAIEVAGQIMSTEMGLVMSAQIDPISRHESSPVGAALVYLASLLFLISGSHHAVFAAFRRSFELAPIGHLSLNAGVAELFVYSTGRIFVVAVQMAAPLMAVNFIVTFTFAILGKAAPSINVFAESFSVRILAGVALLGLTLGLTVQIALSNIRQSPELMLRLIP